MQDLENKVKHRDKHQELHLGELGQHGVGVGATPLTSLELHQCKKTTYIWDLA